MEDNNSETPSTMRVLRKLQPSWLNTYPTICLNEAQSSLSHPLKQPA